MNNQEIEDLLNKFYEGKTSLKEEEELSDLFKKPAVSSQFKSAAFHFELIGHSKEKKLSEDFEQNLERKLSDSGASNSFSYYKIAASIVFILLMSGLAYFILFRTNEQNIISISTNKREQKELLLPDGSKVWLNSSSSISYPEKFDESKREVTLEGEGFFEVYKDPNHPFVINSSNTVTEVLGTSFNLKSYSNEGRVEIAVVTGKVAFSAAEENLSGKVLLLASNGATFKKKDHSIKKVNSVDENLFAWRTHKLVFNNVPLKEVTKVLSQHFDTKILISAAELQECRFKGTFKEAKLDEIFAVISYSMSITVEKNADSYILKGKGCK